MWIPLEITSGCCRIARVERSQGDSRGNGTLGDALREVLENVTPSQGSKFLSEVRKEMVMSKDTQVTYPLSKVCK